jgi:hypothetical protein
MARGCHGRSKKLKVKNWKETAKDRRTWRDLAEKAKNPQRVVVPSDDDDDDDDIHIALQTAASWFDITKPDE